MATNIVKKVAFLSTYPPRECGLATFTEDLVNSMNKISLVQPSVIAVAKKEDYVDPRVKFIVNQQERSSYLKAALWANRHADLLIIEHEYGIFGGDCGEYVLDLAKGLKIPFIVTTHTVLLSPSPKQKTVLRDLGKLSAKVVTMAESSIPILTGTYDVPTEKIAFIPHGVPSMRMASREQLKLYYPDLQNKQIISSFGLISPAKGLEYGIKALAKVVPDYHNVLYLILGKTHPAVKERMGESYRQSLMDLAENLGIREHVLFIDKYLTKEEVITYLQLSDMYLTPYLSREQAVSGTLAYAMGYGRVIISTPYRYAQEMLGSGRGLLAQFRDADSLAACMRIVLGNPSRKKEMELKTMAAGRKMTWENVAGRYAELCISTIGNRNSQLQKDLRLPVHLPDKHVSFPFEMNTGNGMKARL
ncbi:MAG: glycosyltransferase family 4 protein [Veillonellales bacterium]